MAEKLPSSDTGKSLVPLIPTKEEIAEILKQVSQAQKEKPDLMEVPVAILRAWTDCVVRKAVNRLEGECGKASDELKAEMMKPAEQLDKAINQYKDELEKAIKRFRDGANI